jgi:hypothetical protein
VARSEVLEHIVQHVFSVVDGCLIHLEAYAIGPRTLVRFWVDAGISHFL